MQTATIDISQLEKYSDEDVSEILKDWGNRYLINRAALRLGAIGDSDDKLGENRPTCGGWVALWHRNGHDYIHRSSGQPFKLNRQGVIHKRTAHTDRLFKLLTVEGFRKQIKGKVVLYKSGSGRTINRHDYPIRLTDGRYCFLTGNFEKLLLFTNSERFQTEEADLLFNLWLTDNVVAPDSRRNHDMMSFKRRCWKIFMLLNYYDEDFFNAEFDKYSHSESRAGFLVWQRGEVITQWAKGGMAHPKY